MNSYERYQAALAVLRQINARRDFSEAGEQEFQQQLVETRRLYVLVCRECLAASQKYENQALIGAEGVVQ